jgi:hypothetical protein
MFVPYGEFEEVPVRPDDAVRARPFAKMAA